MRRSRIGMPSVLFPLAVGEQPVQSTGDKNAKHFYQEKVL
jgi:hypothetical protein